MPYGNEDEATYQDVKEPAEILAGKIRALRLRQVRDPEPVVPTLEARERAG